MSSERLHRARPAAFVPPSSFHWLIFSTHHVGDPSVPSRWGGTLGARGGACAHAQRSGSGSGRGRKGWCSRFPGLPEGAGVRAHAGRAALVSPGSLARVRARGGPQSGGKDSSGSGLLWRVRVLTSAGHGGKVAVSPGGVVPRWGNGLCPELGPAGVRLHSELCTVAD